MSARLVDYVNVASFSRKIRRHGGVAIYAKTSAARVFPLPFDVSGLCVEIDFEVSGIIYNDVQIITIYRSPRGDFDVFLLKLDMLLRMLKFSKRVVLTGDFNVHFRTGCRQVQLLCGLCESYGLSGTNLQNTRNSACPENVFTNFGESDWVSTVIDPYLSDHMANSFQHVIRNNIKASILQDF